MFHTGSSLRGLNAEKNNKDEKIDFIKWVKCLRMIILLERLIEKIMAITCNVYVLISVSDVESGKTEKENYVYNLLKMSRKKESKYSNVAWYLWIHLQNY